MPKSKPASGNHLDSLLTRKGKAAFSKLCEHGCDRHVLGPYFTLFAVRKPIVIDGPHGRKPLKVFVSPFDTWSGALTPKDGKRPLDPDDLRRIAARALRLCEDIDRLKTTPLVVRLVQEQAIPPGDLLAGSLILTSPPKIRPTEGTPPKKKPGRKLVPGLVPSPFNGILNLPKLAKSFGPQKTPDYTRRLSAIYRHIHERTGQWHDAWVADILNDLLLDAEHPDNAESLKQWRSRHGLAD
jgi:hypothetical protein